MGSEEKLCGHILEEKMAVPGVMGSIRWTDSGQQVQKDYVEVKKDDTSALVLPSSTLTSLSGERAHVQHYFHPATSAELSTQHKAPSLRARLDHSERLMSGIADRPGHKRDFSQYSVRLETFECGPEPWPRAFPNPHHLALVGFYYTGYEHTVVCFLCEAEVSDWDDGKDPLIKHYNKNPNCSFILGEFSSDLEKLLSEEKVLHRSPHYASSSLRLHTFSNWQHSNLITSYQLASAGFFYTGHGLRVECFSCGLTLQDWKRGDLPLHVHRQQSPNCPFIGSLLSKESPESVVGAQQQPPTPSDYPASRAPDYSNLTVRIRSFKHLARNFPVSGERCAEAGLFFLRKPDVMKCFSCGVILRDWINGDIPEEKHREINPRCTFLLEAFPSKLIGVGEEREEGGDIDPSTLPEPEFDEEDLERMSMVERAKAKSQQLDEDIGEAAQNLSKLSVNSPTSQPNIVSNFLSLILKWAKADNNCFVFLQGSLEATEYSDTGSMCVVCMDAPLEMVLIPCRHMCVCEGCSKHLISCPMCRQTVQDALKVFFP